MGTLSQDELNLGGEQFRSFLRGFHTNASFSEAIPVYHVGATT